MFKKGCLFLCVTCSKCKNLYPLWVILSDMANIFVENSLFSEKK